MAAQSFPEEEGLLASPGEEGLLAGSFVVTAIDRFSAYNES